MTLRELAWFLRSPAVAGWKKALVGLTALYVLSPLDLIPDALPLVGWLDDVGVLALAWTWLSGQVRAAGRAGVVEGQVVERTRR